MTTDNDSVDANTPLSWPKVRSPSICSTAPSLVIILPELSASMRLTAYASNRKRPICEYCPYSPVLQYPRPAPRLQQDTPLPDAMQRTHDWMLAEMCHIQGASAFSSFAFPASFHSLFWCIPVLPDEAKLLVYFGVISLWSRLPSIPSSLCHPKNPTSASTTSHNAEPMPMYSFSSAAFAVPQALHAHRLSLVSRLAMG
ncbi:hypothetical protein B0H19DRAFT_1260009 [Mycena capillaripes]|nr:hypothetical protein B0H19DRAFT_1260009 [Mycena capillaripes]